MQCPEVEFQSYKATVPSVVLLTKLEANYYFPIGSFNKIIIEIYMVALSQMGMAYLHPSHKYAILRAPTVCNI